jgi:hypothetical protein
MGAVLTFGKPDSTSFTLEAPGLPSVITGTRSSDFYGLYGFKATRFSAPVLAAGTTHETPELWHRRMGHLGYDNLAKLPTMVSGMNVSPEQIKAAAKSSDACETCIMAKQTRLPFPSWPSDQPVNPEQSTDSAPLSLLHTDLMGPMPVPSVSGARYVLTVLDDATSLAIIALLEHKSEAASSIIDIINFQEKQTGKTVKAVQSDRGGEYLNTELSDYFKRKGIAHRLTAPYTPQQNGKAERLNRTLMERVRAMLHNTNLPAKLWAECVSTANHVRNRSPVTGKDKTPWELMYSVKPDVTALRVFGCTAYVHVPKNKRNKLQPVAEKGQFIGYVPHAKSYKIWVNGSIVISRDVTFVETPVSQCAQPSIPDEHVSDPMVFPHAAPATKPAPAAQLVAPAPHSSDNEGDKVHVQPEPEQQAEPPAGQRAEPSDSEGDQEQQYVSKYSHISGRRPEDATSHAQTAEYRTVRPGYTRGTWEPSAFVYQADPQAVDRYWNKGELPAEPLAPDPGQGTAADAPPGDGAALMAGNDSPAIPQTYEQAMASPDRNKWKAAMDEEIMSLNSHNTWQYAKPPPGVKVIPVRWVFAVKRDATGKIERYKARLVAKGFMQREGMDFDEVFAPTSKLTTFRMLLSLVASRNLELHQLDIKTAFLNGDIDTEVYLQQPPGFEQPDRSLACLLNKTLYGLRQAPRAWYQHLKQELESMGATATDTDPGLYIIHRKDSTIYLLVWVDDILIAAPDTASVNWVKQRLNSVFDSRDLGEAKLFVGISIDRDRTAGTIKISQRRLVDVLLTKFGMDECKSRATPLEPGTQLTKDESNLLDKGQYPYAELIGSLIYLAVCTRPDIAQAVSALSRYMAKPASTHWTAAKGVLRYLAGTADLGITYRAGDDHLYGFSDADHGGDKDTRRSTTGYAFLLNSGAISWSSKLQPTVAASTTEAEYMATAFAVKEALWLRKLSSEFGLSTAATPIYGDNQSAQKLLKHPVANMRSKHIDVIYHFSRERAERGEVEYIYVHTDDNVADIFTKALKDAKFIKFRSDLGMA